MKIGVLFLREGSAESQDAASLGCRLPQSRHEFERLYISKSNVEAEIDRISDDKYDAFLNYMAVDSNHDFLTVSAITKYLEAKNVVLVNRLFLTLTSGETEERRRFTMPITIGDLNWEQLKNKCWTTLSMEIGHEAMAFSSIQQTTGQASDGLADFAWVRQDSLQSLLKSMAIKVLRSSGAGFGRVEAWLRGDSDGMYLEAVFCPPRAIFHQGNSTYEDMVIDQEFPGGQMAFVDMLIATKHIRSGQDRARNQHLAEVYDGFATRYHANRADTGLSRMQEDLSRDYDFSGTVLDLACGNGEFGAILREKDATVKVTGIDVSEGMTQSSFIQDHYEKPLLIGPMDELIMGMPEFDHVVCFGAFQFLDAVHLTACLARMYMIGRKSVTAICEDLSEVYIEDMKRRNGELCSNFNHIRTLEEFGVPKGWKQVLVERFPSYNNPHIGEMVYGIALRFERL